jgi:RNA polymerase sigma-70 factor (ECF subfamily)
LLAGLRSGDPQAYEALVRQHGGRMLAVARRFLRSTEDCADAMQEAWLAVIRSLETFAGQASLATWLHRIVVNACLMQRRSRSRRHAESLEILVPGSDESGPVCSWAGSPRDLLAWDETRMHIHRCIDRLPETYRSVLLLRDIEELDTAQTATHLGISAGSVKTRLHRARQALRDLLRPALASRLTNGHRTALAHQELSKLPHTLRAHVRDGPVGETTPPPVDDLITLGGTFLCSNVAASLRPDEQIDDMLAPLVHEHGHLLIIQKLQPAAAQRIALIRQVDHRRREIDMAVKPRLDRVRVRRGHVHEHTFW